MAVSQNDVNSLSMGGDCPVQCNMHERVARDSMIACLETSVQCTGRCTFSEVGSRAPLQFQNFELHGKPGTGAGLEDRTRQAHNKTASREGQVLAIKSELLRTLAHVQGPAAAAVDNST